MSDPTEAELTMKISILDNNVVKGDYKLSIEIPIKMSDSDNMAYDSDWSTCQERNAQLENHRGKVYSMILG